MVVRTAPWFYSYTTGRTCTVQNTRLASDIHMGGKSIADSVLEHLVPRTVKCTVVGYDMRFETVGSRVYGTWYMVHGTWYMVHGTWYKHVPVPIQGAVYDMQEQNPSSEHSASSPLGLPLRISKVYFLRNRRILATHRCTK